MKENYNNKKPHQVTTIKKLGNKQNFIGAYGFIDDINGQPVALLYVEEHSIASADFSNNLLTYIKVLIATIIISILIFIFFLERLLVKPLKKIEDAISAISTGDLTEENVEDKYNDELSGLAKVHNNVLSNLREIVSLIQDKANKVDIHSNQLSSNMDNMVLSSSETTANAIQIAANFDSLINQLDLIEKTSAEILEKAKQHTHTQSNLANVSGLADDNNPCYAAIKRQEIEITQLSKALKDSLLSIQGIVATTEEQTLIIEEISLTAKNLSKMAEELNQISLRFKVTK